MLSPAGEGKGRSVTSRRSTRIGLCGAARLTLLAAAVAFIAVGVSLAQARSPEPGPPKARPEAPATPAFASSQATPTAHSLPDRSAPADDTASPRWTEQAVVSLSRTEYRFSRGEDGAWSAPNRAHNLRTRIGDGHVEVIPRLEGAEETAGGWKLRLTVSGLGRQGHALEPVSAPMIEEAPAGRIQYRRSTVTEWYRNDEAGLEQGFTIASPPGGGRGARDTRDERALVLDMKIDGDLLGDVSGDRRSILFKNGRGKPVLRYGELAVYDASGATLRAWLRLEPGRLQILVEDAHAVYPITIDPLITTAAWTSESNQASAQFAASVATAGDVNGDGYSDVVVGAPFYDGGQTDEGRAFVFLGSASGLALAPAWTAESNQASAQMGASVASAGDVNGDGYDDVLIGAPLYDNGQTDEGRAFVFLGSGSGLGANGDPTNADWSAESNQASARVGAVVGTAGDVNGDGYADVVLGSPLYDNGQTDEGRAFVFLGSAAGLGANGDPTNADWLAESNQASSQLGASVATAGDVDGDGFGDVIVGAPLYDNGQTDEGRAFVFLGSASGLGATGDPSNADCSPRATRPASRLGSRRCDRGRRQRRRLRRRDRRGAVLRQRPDRRRPRVRLPRLGVRPGATGPADAMDGREQPGRARSSAPSLAPAGDVNGDGYADVVVGAPALRQRRTATRAARSSSLGSAAGPRRRPPPGAWRATRRDAFLGISVGAAGDVNGDGFGDVIVGSHLYDNGQSDEGRAFVFLGSAGGSGSVAGLDARTAIRRAPTSASRSRPRGTSTATAIRRRHRRRRVLRQRPDQRGARLRLPRIAGGTAGRAFVDGGERPGRVAASGTSVATAGDVNGDGYSDVIVGAYLFDNGQTDEGRAFVYLGSASGLGAAARLDGRGQPDVGAVRVLRRDGAGDVNGDGYADVVVGAFGFNNGQIDEGARLSSTWARPRGSPPALAWTARGQPGRRRLRLRSWRRGRRQRRRLQRRHRRRLAVRQRPDQRGPRLRLPRLARRSGDVAGVDGREQPGGRPVRLPVASAGDVNGDGYSDVLVGATAYDDGETGRGPCVSSIWARPRGSQ